MSVQVYLQRGKLLLALQAVRRGMALTGLDHPQVHLMAVRLCQRAQSEQQVRLHCTQREHSLVGGVLACHAKERGFDPRCSRYD